MNEINIEIIAEKYTGFLKYFILPAFVVNKIFVILVLLS